MVWRLPALLAAASLFGVAAIPAAATTPVPPARTTPVTPPPPKVAQGSMRLYLLDAFFVNRQPVTVPGRRMHVDGVVRPWVPGQWVTVRTYLGRRLIKTDRLRIKPSRRHLYGRFTESFSSPRVGDLTVSATHSATSQQTAFKAGRGMSALGEQIGFGSTGRFVELVQQRLLALHFYIPQTGVYDTGTGLAIDAYHRLLHWGTYQTLDGATISWLLDGFGAFKVRYQRQGRHAEGNLGLQLLALVNGSKVYWILPISSGKPTTPTILGSFQIYRRVPFFRPDGMYFSSYFISGYAIHGYDPAPDYPASHGCMRLPMVDAIPVYNWLNFGDWVDTYY